MEHEKNYQSTVLAIYYFLNKCYIFVTNVIIDIVAGLPDIYFQNLFVKTHTVLVMMG